MARLFQALNSQRKESLRQEWMINAGYTYLHVDQVTGEARNSSFSMDSGDYSYERPKHAINLATSYQAADDLTVGLCGGNIKPDRG